MDLRKISKFEGSFQYVPPRCFELAGRRFELLMDDGYDIVLDFIDNSTVKWNYVNKEPTAPQTDEYECRKGDDTTYFVTWCLAGKEMAKRENFTFVIDLEQMLVTHVIARMGVNPRWPYLVTTDFVFGAIKQEGVEFKPYPRHGFTDDMVGNIVKWQYAPEMATIHAYHASHWYRITYPREDIKTEEAKARIEAMNQMVSKLPGPDEPTDYVKIKDGLYLVSLTERNMEKVIGADGGFRSDTLCFLDNFHNHYNVGRGFGTITRDGKDYPVYVMIGAYGKVFDADSNEDYVKLMTDPNPFLP